MRTEPRERGELRSPFVARPWLAGKVRRTFGWMRFGKAIKVGLGSANRDNISGLIAQLGPPFVQGCTPRSGTATNSGR